MLISQPRAEFYYEKDILKHMEYCGRNCYNSYASMTDTSAKEFLEKRIKTGEWSVLEHAGIILPDNAHPKVTPDDVQFGLLAARAGATGGIRVSDALKYQFVDTLDDIVKAQRDPELYTFKITCSRATAAQFDRNRNISVSERSFRYCKFDSLSDFQVCSTYSNTEHLKEMEKAWVDSYTVYKNLIDAGVPCDEARYVLPMASATTIMVTAAKYWWKVMLTTRYAPHTSTDYIKICKDIAEAKPELAEHLDKKAVTDANEKYDRSQNVN